jgi:D-alanyl-D-alanine carboxypeptidase (penicillin-binding protein 5/6)
MAIAATTVATRYPDLLAISGVKDQVIPATDTHAGFSMHSLIKLVSTYPGATGLKTGYTDDAGYCLAGTASHGSRHLVVVLLQSDTELTRDAQKLLDYGFSTPPDPPAPQ